VSLEVLNTYLLALMPSLRVAKPSATSDSAMFSPLVSEEEEKEIKQDSNLPPLTTECQ
jgi:hypothetical protein